MTLRDRALQSQGQLLRPISTSEVQWESHSPSSLIVREMVLSTKAIKSASSRAVAREVRELGAERQQECPGGVPKGHQ
ncbi:hypothetical protein AAFF_G00153340 [Aldrovandia affinis]|uniref:Uncharacterized protein n=1 Tax=Aldrovandia affinis TaxID=143900 RepID=A0AAD7T1M1_9TELE|nr:hypothetical protein AAFF_G00153340 [Aldrovandia affinis]